MGILADMLSAVEALIDMETVVQDQKSKNRQ